MTATADFDDSRGYTVTRTYAAPRDRLWRALLEALGPGRAVEEEAPVRLVVDAAGDTAGADGTDRLAFTLSEQEGRTEIVARRSGGYLSDAEYDDARADTSALLDELEEIVNGVD